MTESLQMLAQGERRSTTTAVRTGAASTWKPPAEFDDYAILHPLGSGQMGHVYLAEDTVLARHVAVKFIAVLDPDIRTRQRFLFEARAAARVQHPNVVTVHRVGELDQQPYIVSEFVRGHTLEQIEQMTGPMPWKRVLQIGVDLARGLAAAHRKGVLHRDIKPANAIVTDDGLAKLLDFGLATVLQPRSDDDDNDNDNSTSEVRQIGDDGVVGTPDFMAPEVWRGERGTRESDVFSLGAVLYELCTGAAPFHDVPLEMLSRAVNERDAAPLARIAPGVDARFAAILDRCLRRAPSARYASGDDLREALEQLERSGSAGALPEGNPYRGLRAFDIDHRALFFGRRSEIGAVLDRLRSESFMLVTGDSGVGKSSLCRAGVVPAIQGGALGADRTWDVVTLVPGKLPLTALANALADKLDCEPKALAQRILDDDAVLGRDLARRLGAKRGLVIFIDQIEEILTVSDAREREAVDRALSVIAAGTPGVRVLATLRADFLTRFAGLHALGEDLSRVLYFLRPLSPERIREVIVGPAEATGARFEGSALVDQLVEATAHAEGGLPLLQFSLAELWESRNAEGVMTTAALGAMGGVGGALARHGDAVLAGLSTPQRAAARKVLMRLVTLENTRIRRGDAELKGEDPGVRGALDALVRARLLIALTDHEGSAYEIAHEVLIQGWGTLRRWLSEDEEARAVRERLSTSAGEWKRLGRVRDVLWSVRQLDELRGLDTDDLHAHEIAFVQASRKAVTRGRWRRGAFLACAPVVLGVAYASFAVEAHRLRDREVERHLAEARVEQESAHLQAEEARGLRAEAFAAFDAREQGSAESTWARALSAGRASEKAMARASRSLEAALAQDASRGDVRSLFGDVLYERARSFEEVNNLDQRDELAERFVLYDPDGSRARRWQEPASVSISSSPPGAHVTLEPSGEGEPPRDLGTTPIAAQELPRGSYVLVFTAEGRAAVRYPIAVSRGEELPVAVDLPLASAIPEGFVYIPPGRFLYGTSADEASRRGFFSTVPVHEMHGEGFSIRRTEVTFGDWIAYLDSLPSDEQARRAPGISATLINPGALQLARLPGGKWELVLQPAARVYRAAEGEKIDYRGRPHHALQDWRLLPVTAVSADDAEAYVRWLDASGRVPGARLCTEREWERAARGADGREYPQGDRIAPSDANYDESYGRDLMGPDEVGTHPGSQSPFGLEDMSGNAFEWTTSAGAYVVRGGSYYHDQKTIRLINRTETTSALRDPTLGIRLCATPRPRG